MNLSFRSIQILFLVGVIALTVIDAKRLGQPGRNAVVVEDEEAAATTVVDVDARQLQPGEPNYGLTPSEHQQLYGYMDGPGWYGNEYYDGGDYARGRYGAPWGNPMFYASNPQLNQGGRGGGRGNWNNGRGNGRGNNGRGNVYYEEEQYAYGPNGGYYEEEQYYGGRNGGGYYQQDYYSNNGRGNSYGYAAGYGPQGGYAYGGYGPQGGYAYGYGNNNGNYYNQGW